PGCPTPAERCDLDHTIPHGKGGRTDKTNLGPLNRRCHRMRHESPWRVEQPTPGTFRWTSPTGHTYTVEAESLGPVDPRLRDQPPDDEASPEPEDDPPPF
ncbi:MAG: HNH endonuclease, partial [Actinomycetota bacterium]|nr:HNH endonuclease [Actinomycetota bacterium]